MATQLFANNVNTTVASTFSNVATTLNVVDGSRMPSPTGGNWFLLTLFTLNSNGQENAWEIVKVTARATNTLTVVRAQEGTTALSWAVAAGVSLRPTAATLSAKADKANETFTAPAIGSATGVSLSLSTSFTMGSPDAGGRIYGDFASSSHNLRTLFQNFNSNSNTILGVIPNGTGVVSAFNFYNSSDPTNSSIIQYGINATKGFIQLINLGTGVVLPFEVLVNGIVAQTYNTDGTTNINSAIFSKFKETVFEATNVSNVFTIALANGSIQRVTTAANSTIILPAAIPGKSYLIMINYGGAHTITWQVSGGGDIRWPDNNIAPTATMISGRIDKYSFVCFDTVSIFGADAGRNS